METTSGSLLYELQIIWDEVGESSSARDRILLELEEECLDIYRRKVDEANRCRAQLKQAIADAETELAAIWSAMGERPVHIRQSDQSYESLNAELGAILPQLEEMRKRKKDRKNQYIQVLGEMQGIKNEINGSNTMLILNDSAIDEGDLSIRKLEELQKELQAHQQEKNKRLTLVLDRLRYLQSLCSVLGLDFKNTVSNIHPSFEDAEGPKHISNCIIEQLGNATLRLRDLKIQRMQQLQDLAASLLELWNLMDTPIEEQQIFQNVTSNLVASEDEITSPNLLSLDYINYVKAEVCRLEELKVSKMKELVLKKKAELEAICRKTRILTDEDHSMEITIDALESGAIDAACVLEQIELQIAKVKEEAFSRKDILEKIDKWMAACEEESWLDEYNRDENRYNAGRGAHLALKRAEKARGLINKLPAMMNTLASKVIAWENERGVEFTYDGVHLLSMLEAYTALQKEKELERKRQRDQKKLQGQLQTEQEAIYGSKPSPMKKKGPKLSRGGASGRRLSLGTPVLQTPKSHKLHSAKATPNTWNAKRNDGVLQEHRKNEGFAPPSSGRRALDMTDLHVKQQESSVMRKPFSPISSAASILENPNSRIGEMAHKALTPVTTPTKIISSAAAEGLRTPQTVAIHAPFTPSMQTAIAPAPSKVSIVDEDIEYSFEERRAGFVVPRSLPMVVMQQ